MSRGNTTWEPVIGLEIHVQLATESRLFTSCTLGAGDPNTAVDEVVLGLPGTLPTTNYRAIEYAARLGVAVGSRVRRVSRFARKHYFYPDLPKGYQTSQFDEPICEGGSVEIDLEDGTAHTVPLTRIHLEEDAGKTVHDPGAGVSRVDYNRAGTPLVEIVSEPALRSSAEAVAYLKAVHSLVRALGISDGNMEAGNFRCDANISVRPSGSTGLGTRVELKNINSFRFVGRALDYEFGRQTRLIERGGEVDQETRQYDDATGRTSSMRGKEDAHDYRYMTCPDLPPVVVSEAWLSEIRASLPELPRERAARYVQEFGLPDYDAKLLSGERERSQYFEAVIASGVRDPKLASNWILSELQGALGAAELELSDSPVSPEALGAIVVAIEAGRISGKMAKAVFDKVFREGKDPEAAIADVGEQLTTPESLEPFIAEVVNSNPDKVEQYRAGKHKLIGFFVGQIMRATKGRANPGLLNRLLKERLDS